MYFIVILILAVLLLSYKHLLNFYKLKTVKQQTENITERNKKFVRERLKYIVDYFNNDTFIRLTVNYKSNEIIGFFISINKESEFYNSFSKNRLPTISHELDIDEFCSFLQSYTNEVNDRDNLVKNIMREHMERLKC